jgi:LacI family transcriptional regulator
MSEAGLVVEESWTGLAPEGLAGWPVTAVFCGSQEHTARVLRALAMMGRSEQVAVVGFGDFGLADYMRPGLTVARYDPAEVGKTAAELVFRRLAGDDGPARRVEVPVRLVTRGSGEIPPIRQVPMQ